MRLIKRNKYDELKFEFYLKETFTFTIPHNLEYNYLILNEIHRRQTNITFDNMLAK